MGVDVIALLRPHVVSIRKEQRSVAFDPDVFEALLPEISADKLIGRDTHGGGWRGGPIPVANSILVAALHSVRTAKACLAKCKDELRRPFAFVHAALEQHPPSGTKPGRRDPAVSPEVLQCLWDAVGETLMKEWTASERKKLLQAAVLSGQLATIDFALNVMNIPLSEPLGLGEALGDGCREATVAPFQVFNIPQQAVIPPSHFLHGADLLQWNDVQFQCLKRLQEHSGPSAPLFDAKMLVLGCFPTLAGARDGSNAKENCVSDFTRFLVEEQGVDVNCQIATNIGDSGVQPLTPVKVAAIGRNIVVMKYLLEHGAKLDPTVFLDVFAIPPPPRTGNWHHTDRAEPTSTVLFLDLLIAEIGLDPSLARDGQGNSLSSCQRLMCDPTALGFLLPHLDLGGVGADGHIPLTRWLESDPTFWQRDETKVLVGCQQSWNPHWKHPNGTGLDLLHIAILTKDFPTFALACHRLGMEYIARQECVTLSEGTVKVDEEHSRGSSGLGGGGGWRGGGGGGGWGRGGPAAAQVSREEESPFGLIRALRQRKETQKHAKQYTPVELARGIGEDGMARYLERLLEAHN